MSGDRTVWDQVFEISTMASFGPYSRWQGSGGLGTTPAMSTATELLRRICCHSFEWPLPLDLLQRRSYSSPQALLPPMRPPSHPWTALLHQPTPAAEPVAM
jgi:hypothetical protein